MKTISAVYIFSSSCSQSKKLSTLLPNHSCVPKHRTEKPFILSINQSGPLFWICTLIFLRYKSVQMSFFFLSTNVKQSIFLLLFYINCTSYRNVHYFEFIHDIQSTYSSQSQRFLTLQICIIYNVHVRFYYKKVLFLGHGCPRWEWMTSSFFVKMETAKK